MPARKKAQTDRLKVGIIIRMFYFDTHRYKTPHVHVQYAEENAVLGLPAGDVLQGNLRSSKMKVLQAWLETHRDALMADWQLAVEGQPVLKIAPLR